MISKREKHLSSFQIPHQSVIKLWACNSGTETVPRCESERMQNNKKTRRAQPCLLRWLNFMRKFMRKTCASECWSALALIWFDIWSHWHLTIISDSLQRDEPSTAANLLICRRRRGPVMNCGGLLLDPLHPSVIDTVRREDSSIFCIDEWWVRHRLHTVFPSVCPEEGSLGGICIDSTNV